MVSLECRVGGLELNQKGLVLKESLFPDSSKHKFLVELKNKEVLIHVAPASGWEGIAERFYLDESVFVGGGNFYLDKEGRLVIDGCDSEFGAIPETVAQELAELILADLKKEGVEARGVEASPNEDEINRYWKELGFDKGSRNKSLSYDSVQGKNL